ncbi:MAG: type II secretion system F family protein [Hadesarchaea archaeon]|nr:type II secretion system F family protein [Hadesarchaea archaeon]
MKYMPDEENSEGELSPLMEEYKEETGKEPLGSDGEPTKDYREWRTKQREESDDSILSKIFSKIGGAVIKTGETTTKAPGRLGGAMKGLPSMRREREKEKRGLQDRLKDLKHLETRREEISRERTGRWDEAEGVSAAREAELEEPLSERMADTFYKPLKAPARKLVGFFTGLEEDLYKARMQIPVVRYVALMMGIGLIAGIGGFVLAWLMLGFLMGIIVGPVALMITMLLMRRRPKLRVQSRIDEVNQTLPYALRHISTQLSSGIGLPETMSSVSEANYGALSEEFERVLRDMRAGSSTAEALERMTQRVESDPLNRTARQIQRTLRTGGNLSETLGMLADETALDMRMKLRDYTQSLNMMGMVYMFASAVVPALFIVLLIVMQFIGGASVPVSLVAVLYLLGLPFILFYLVMIFKKMEPGA